MAGGSAGLYFMQLSVIDRRECGISSRSSRNSEKQITKDKELETVNADSLTLNEGQEFDIKKDFTGISLEEGDSITLKEVKGEKHDSFDINQPDTYHCTYLVVPQKGNSYEIVRKIIVRPRETQSKSTASGKKETQNSTEEEADPETEDSETDAVSEDSGVFLSVVPSAMQKSREPASLEKGEDIYYPSDLGNYLTCRFTVNGKIAYCIESSKASPPSADYVAQIYESNLNLQKVLYYGYGGPGDLTGSYLSGYNEDVRYILTHLAASYAYAGAAVAFEGCYESGLEKYGVMNYINYLYSQEAPPKAALSLSSEKENAYAEGDIQRTGNITLEGDHRNYITLKLPEEVTYHSGSTSQTGGTVKITGGTSFYFSAPKTVHGTWESGTLNGQMGGQWKTLVVSTGGTTQDIGYGEFYEEPNASVSFTIKWKDFAWVKVIKADDATGVNLAGAVFGVYSDKGCTKLITEMPATDEKGASKVELEKTQDIVYLKEISVPTGYKLNTSVFNIKLLAGETTNQAVTNQEQKGKITVKKQGEILSGVSGEAGELKFTYSNTAYANAKYKIYAAADIMSQDKKTVIHKAGDMVGELVTGKDGSVTSKELYLGAYRVIEQEAPHNLVIGKTEEKRTHDVTLSYAGQTVELAASETTFTNDRPEIKVNVVKKSKNDDVTLEGAVFGLYAAEDIKKADGTVLVKKDTLIERKTSDSDGNAVFTADIPIDCSYYVKEIQAPEDYYMSSGRYDFTYSYKDDDTYQYTFAHTFTNKEVRGEVHVSKIDTDAQDFISQGDASLDGAVYGLYAAEDIDYPNRKSGIVHKKDELVAQGTIKEGKTDFTNLYLGNYYVKEISAGEGYLLDETKYPVEVGYEGQEIEIVHRNVVVKEKVKKQAFELIKISEDGDQTETDVIKGAGFKIYLISELKGVKDGSLKPSSGTEFSAEDFIGYDYSKEETAHYYENGKKVSVEEMFTDEKGYLKSPELPYGKYVVFESTTPDKLQTINPFLVTIKEDSRDPQPWRIFDDRPIQFYFKIIKEDAQTGLPVLKNHAQYKIYDVEKEEYVSMKVRYPEVETIDVFETNDEGYLQTPEQLKMGTYRIEEIKAPELFVQPGKEMALLNGETQIPLNQVTTEGEYNEAGKEGIMITVDSNTAYEVEEGTGKHIVVIRQQNDEAVGSLKIKKTGEFITGADNNSKKLTATVKNAFANIVNRASEALGGEELVEKTEGYSFSYETGPAAGAEFAVYAKETIYSPDGQKDEEGNRIVRYEKDALVAELVTGEDGTAMLNNLPIGSYYLVETKAAENSVLDPEEKEFTISYQGQEVAVDYVSKELHNERQKIELTLLKISAETKEAVAGAEFGLYAMEDIVNLQGEVLVEKDTLIAKGISKEDGLVEFGADLPHGKYYAKELTPAPGYLPDSETVYEFDATYQNPEIPTITIQSEVENQPTIVEISKKDITDEKEVPGAKLQILDQDGEVVAEWVSGEKPHTIYALEPGEYTLHEEAAPRGYLVVSDVPFEVQENGEIQKVEMHDERPVGQLIVKKTDSENQAPLKGVEFEIRNKATGETVGTLITGEDGTAKSEELPVALYENGKYVEPIVYILAETKALEGYEDYAKEEEFTFEYQDDKTKVIEVTKEIQNTRKPGVEAPDAPKTGDQTMIWIPVALAVIGVIGIVLVLYRIRKNRR